MRGGMFPQDRYRDRLLAEDANPVFAPGHAFECQTQFVQFGMRLECDTCGHILDRDVLQRFVVLLLEDCLDPLQDDFRNFVHISMIHAHLHFQKNLVRLMAEPRLYDPNNAIVLSKVKEKMHPGALFFLRQSGNNSRCNRQAGTLGNHAFPIIPYRA